MKNTFFSFTILITIFFIVSQGMSQIHFSAGPQMGVALPMSDYSGDVSDFYNGRKYGLKPGFNFGATVKAELLLIAGRIDINYSFFKNDGNIAGFNNANATVKQNMLTIGLGPEFKFDIPLFPITPYGSLELLYTSFSGSFRFNGTPLVSASDNDISSSSRVGIGLLLGTEIKLGVYALDVSLRYNMHNLIGKSFSGYTNNDRTNSYLNLNDDNDPAYGGDNHPVASSRNITSLMLNVGILFGF